MAGWSRWAGTRKLLARGDLYAHLVSRQLSGGLATAAD